MVDHAESSGGSAANTMVGLSRLGCKVGFVGKVAHDREGMILLEDFKKEGVSIEGVIHGDNGHSGQVMGFVDNKGDRALYIDSGVNDTIVLEEIKVEYASDTKFLHFTSFVGEESFKTQKRLLDAISEEVKISFDPGALYAMKGLPELEPILKRSYVVMPNAVELEHITGKEDYCSGADVLIGKGVGVVAVKLGANGCYVTDGRERIRVEAFKTNVVDTTGAGDAFCAGFLYGLLHEKSLGDCGKLGNFVASRCVVMLGARAGLPYIENLGFLR